MYFDIFVGEGEIKLVLFMLKVVVFLNSNNWLLVDENKIFYCELVLVFNFYKYVLKYMFGYLYLCLGDILII